MGPQVGLTLTGNAGAGGAGAGAGAGGASGCGELPPITEPNSLGPAAGAGAGAGVGATLDGVAVIAESARSFSFSHHGVTLGASEAGCTDARVKAVSPVPDGCGTVAHHTLAHKPQSRRGDNTRLCRGLSACARVR